MQKWVNYLRGSVCLEVSGAFPERFLNLCGVERLGFWQVERWGKSTLRVWVALWDLHRAKMLAGRAGCRAEQVGAKGLPVFLCAFRSRYGLLAGLALSILLAVFLSQFIFVLNVTGAEHLPETVILTELEKEGLHFGSFRPILNERELASRVLTRLPELSFLSINLSGVYAEVVVREADPEPELRDETTLTDLIAARDGVVVDINALAGQAKVAEGDAVLAGELLVSHESVYDPAEWSDGETYYGQTHARGEVWAVTKRTLSARMPLSCVTKGDIGGKTVRYGLRWGKNLLKFSQNSSISGGSCDRIKEAWRLTLPAGLSLPLWWERETRQEWTMLPTTLTEEEAEAALKEKLEGQLAAIVGQGQILNRSWQTETADDTVTVTLTASCVEDIAKETPVAGEDSAP